MFARKIIITIFLCGMFHLLNVPSVRAEGFFINAPNRVDMVHDSERKILYITSGSQVLRYSLTTKNFLAPFDLGGDLKGIDLSPDKSTLAVADAWFANGQLWIHLINLRTGIDQKITFPQTFYEGGTFSVAYGKDGAILVTSQYQGSGWVRLRRYNPASGITTILLPMITQNTMLTNSADGNTIAFAESNSSDGPWGRYRVSDSNLVERTGYDDGTSWFNYEIGVNRNGAQFAIPTGGGTFIYNASFAKIAILGQYAGPQPIGVVYHPCKDIVYFAWTETPEVRAFETAGFTQVTKYNFEYGFQNVGNWAYQDGRLKIAREGNLLFATVGGGIRYVALAESMSCVVAPREVPEANTLGLLVGGGGMIAIWLGWKKLGAHRSLA